MYYVALICPEETDNKVNEFKFWIKQHFGCVIALKSPAHITLIPPFWLELKMEPELIKTLQSFRSNMDELEIHLDGFSHFGKRVLFVDVKNNPALIELRNQAANHFLKSFSDVIKKEDRSFYPHITIATRDIKPGEIAMALNHLNNVGFHEHFRISTISLLKLSPTKWNVINSANWK